MSGPSDPAGGVKVFSIGGRMIHPRERCLGMTNEERRWRAQFLKDQILNENEPRNVPELYRATTNVFRRLWKTPMWRFQNLMSSILGKEYGYYARHAVGKITGLLLSTYLIAYYLKYHSNDWTTAQNWRIYQSRSTMYPDDPNYPSYPKKTDQEYVDLGFYSSPYVKKIKNLSKGSSSSKTIQKNIEVECLPIN